MSARARPDDGKDGTRSRPILLPLDVSSRWIAAHLRLDCAAYAMA